MSKKPAKKPTGPSAPAAPKDTDGVLTLFIGAVKGVFVTCPYCGGQKRKGMMRDYKGNLYCSRGCVKAVKREEEANAGQ